MVSRIEICQVSKSFPGVKALEQVTMSVNAGEVHALCGENGAGKSTLMNILSGNLRPDEGHIKLDGRLVEFKNPQEAFDKGIGVVYQHLSLADELSIAENIFANQHPVNRFGLIDFPLLHAKTRELLLDLNISLDSKAIVTRISPAQKQMVEIAKALAKRPQVLILDEPTASLTGESINVLFHIIRKLRQEGTSIIYISHRLSEIFQIADRISILKDGKFQGTFQKDELSKEKLIQYMVGREIKEADRQVTAKGEVLLEVKNLSSGRFRNISFRLHKGELLGVAGLIGAGRTEIARTIFGIDSYESGEIKMDGKVIRFRHPEEAIQIGLGYVPEDRKTLGLFLEMNLTDNIVAASLKHFSRKNIFDQARANETAKKLKHQLNIITPSLLQRAINLSGGNQQKVLMAKWLAADLKVLIVDEPTHGVDVGAKQEIYNILRNLVRNGLGVIIISSELPELLSLCDRILVIKEGELTGELKGDEATEEKILALAM